MSYIVDEFMLIMHPDAMVGVESSCAIAVGGQGADDLREAVRAHKRALLAPYDTAILEAAGVAVDFLLDAIEQASARKRGATKLRQSQAPFRQAAFRAFAEVAAKGGRRSTAVGEALKRMEVMPGQSPSFNTVCAWWDELSRWGCFSLKKPNC